MALSEQFDSILAELNRSRPFQPTIFELPVVDMTKLNDLEVICSDGSVHVEKSYLARSSEPLYRMITGTDFSHAPGKIKLPETSSATFTRAYQILLTGVLMEGLSDPRASLERPQGGLSETDFADLLHFTHTHLIKPVMDKCISFIKSSKPEQRFFELDKKLSLDLRNYMLVKWMFDRTEPVLSYSDPTIYADLIAFLVHVRGIIPIAKAISEIDSKQSVLSRLTDSLVDSPLELKDLGATGLVKLPFAEFDALRIAAKTTDSDRALGFMAGYLSIRLKIKFTDERYVKLQSELKRRRDSEAGVNKRAKPSDLKDSQPSFRTNDLKDTS